MARPFGTKNIETPEKMWELFQLYCTEIRANPIPIIEQRKGNVILPKGFEGELPSAIVELPARRPFTMEGFENYCADNDIMSTLTDYFLNKDNRYVDYISICSRIKRTIRQDQIEGGMAGIYNPSITQRLNNLVERTQNENVNKEVPLFPDVPTDNSD